MLVAIGVGGRWVDSDSALAEAGALPVALALPAMAAAFFVGLFQTRLYAAERSRSWPAVAGKSTPEELRAALADALRPLAADHLLGQGPRPLGRRQREPVDPPAAGVGAGVSRDPRRQPPVAGIVHDAALSGRARLRPGGELIPLVALEN